MLLMCNKRVSISYEVVRANIIIKQINFFSLSLKIDTYHSHKIKISKAQTQTKSNSKIPNTTMMMFRNSNLVLLAVIAASCTTFSTAVDGQSLLRRHLQDEDPVATDPSEVTSTEDQAEVDSNMGSDVADPSNANASEDTVTSTEDGQEAASGMDGKDSDSEDGPSADDSSTDSDASNANASVNTVTSTEDEQEGNISKDSSSADASIGPGQEGQVAAAAMGESDSSYVADPSTSSAYVSYSMATAAATAAIITGTVMYL